VASAATSPTRRTLAQIASSPTEIAPAVPLLRDAKPKVRQAAVGALASRPAGPSTLPALLDLLQDPDMAPFAAQAVGALRLKEGVEPLTRLLRSTDRVTRRGAARALARLGPLAAPAAEPLMRALQQETGEPRAIWPPSP
jgi:HEAT repeat protein